MAVLIDTAIILTGIMGVLIGTMTMFECNALREGIESMSTQDHPHGSSKINLSYEIPKEIGVHDRMKVLDQSVNVIYNWPPWDPGSFRHSNVYIKVSQRRFGNGLLISTKSNYAQVILNGTFNDFSYQHPHLFWDLEVECVQSNEGLLERKQSFRGEDL